MHYLSNRWIKLKRFFKNKVENHGEPWRTILYQTMKFNYIEKNPTNMGLECSVVSYSHSPSVHSVTPALSALQALP